MRIYQIIAMSAFLGLAQLTHGQCPQICDSTQNTALGDSALGNLTTGEGNTAIGFNALFSNTDGVSNTAIGLNALGGNVGGDDNIAIGKEALAVNSTGNGNAAVGDQALNHNATGSSNAGMGFQTLLLNTTGGNNTAIGVAALLNNTTGSNNVALGSLAGFNLTHGHSNIDIGSAGVSGESKTIRIGITGMQRATYIAGISGAPVAGGVGVMIDSTGRLGTVVSSQRFKERVEPMNDSSEAILSLQPVTFRYKQEFDPDGIPQFGLVAEQVEKVDPDLVVRDEEGKPYSVRYETVNAMLLNEFLKEHRKGLVQDKAIGELEQTVARQQTEIATLSSELREVSRELRSSTRH